MPLGMDWDLVSQAFFFASGSWLLGIRTNFREASRALAPAAYVCSPSLVMSEIAQAVIPLACFRVHVRTFFFLSAGLPATTCSSQAPRTASPVRKAKEPLLFLDPFLQEACAHVEVGLPTPTADAFEHIVACWLPGPTNTCLAKPLLFWLDESGIHGASAGWRLLFLERAMSCTRPRDVLHHLHHQLALFRLRCLRLVGLFNLLANVAG